MPPLSQSSHENTTALDGQRLFTHENVRVLFDIVAAAEESPKAAKSHFGALFDAYEETLARHGLRAELDQIYFRALLRLGELCRTAQSFHEALDLFLQGQGIVLELGSDGPDDMSYSMDAEEMVEETENATSNAPFLAGRKRERRASFTSFIEAEEEDTRLQRGRAGSTGSLSRLQDHSEGFGSRPFRLAKSRSKEKGKTPLVGEQIQHAAQPRRRIGLLEESDDHSQSRFQQHRRSLKVQSADDQPKRSRENRQGELRSRRGALSFSIYEDSTSHGEQSPALPPSSGGLGIDHQKLLFYRPSDTQLVRDAEIFDDFRIRKLARDILSYWGIRAKRDREGHTRWLLQAIEFDERILRRTALEVWSTVAQHQGEQRAAEKASKETEQFYGALEADAAQVYKIFLLTKAFTHWAQCAAEEVERTNEARRHILRLRYFNAWKEITVVNEFKIRKHVLQKFLRSWKAQLGWTSANQDRALILYHGNVVEKVYRHWFWGVCERRIDAWRSARLKRLYLIRWALRLRQNLNRKLRVCNLRGAEIQRRCMGTWSQRAEIARLAQEQAEDYRQRQLIARCLPRWERQLRLAPAARQVQGMVQWRIASSAFSTIQLRLKLALQAELVNRRRIVRNAWTFWNDRLRSQTLLHQIDDRFATQALYRWVLAERFMLMKRLHEERIRAKAFEMMVHHWETVATGYQKATKEMETLRARHLLRGILSEWRSKLQQQRNRETMAFEFCAPKLQQDTMQSWHAKCEHQIQLERWSVEAVYYFRATRTFKVLQAAVVQSRKQKRRDAYVQVRRRVKMNLARNLLLYWREGTAAALALRELPSELIDLRHDKLKANIMGHWHGRLVRTQDNFQLVLERDQTRLLALSLDQWMRRLHEVEQDAQAASNFARSRTEKAAFDCLRRLQLQSLEHQALAVKANTVLSWTDRRQLRALLRDWADRAIEKRSGEKPRAQNSSSAERRSRTPAARRNPVSNLAENVLSAVSPPHPPFSPPPSDPSILTTRSPPAELAQSILLPNFAAVTPLPGYLSTPSKRAARARALVPLSGSSSRLAGQEPTVESFTPATGGLRNIRRSLLGRSILFTVTRGAGGGEPILEDSEESHKQGTPDNREVDDATFANDEPSSGPSQTRDGVRRTLFSSLGSRGSGR